jgi:hypothetical protein
VPGGLESHLIIRRHTTARWPGIARESGICVRGHCDRGQKEFVAFRVSAISGSTGTHSGASSIVETFGPAPSSAVPPVFLHTFSMCSHLPVAIAAVLDAVSMLWEQSSSAIELAAKVQPSVASTV